MANEDKVQIIEGTITMADGTVSNFRIGQDLVWAQWGDATRERLGRSVDVLDAMTEGIRDSGVDYWTSNDEDEDED